MKPEDASRLKLAGSLAAIATVLAPLVSEWVESRQFREQAGPILQQPFNGTQALLLLNDFAYENGLKAPSTESFTRVLTFGPQPPQQKERP